MRFYRQIPVPALLMLCSTLGACERNFEVSIAPAPAAKVSDPNPSVGQNGEEPEPEPVPSTVPVPAAGEPPPASKIVCGAFGAKPKSVFQGLTGRLFSPVDPTDKTQQYKDSRDYIEQGIVSDAALLLANVNVPPQRFNVGFRYGSGADDFLKDGNGNKLFEWFALRLRGELRLNNTDAPGDYEFALLSDDGSTLSLDGQPVVQSEGFHPSRLACSPQVVRLERNVGHALELRYFQGPRDAISIMLLWRKRDASMAADPYCTNPKDNFFFDYTTSQPKPAWAELLSRGWQVVPPENLYRTEAATTPTEDCGS